MGRAYAIDIGASALKAVEVEAGGGKVKILRAVFIPRELPDPEQRPETPAQGLEAATSAMADFQGEGVVGFPSDAVSLRLMATPTADPVKVANLVKAMAGEKLKDAEDQPLVTAHAVLPRVSTAKEDLLLMSLAATEATVQSQLEQVRTIGIGAQELAAQPVGLYLLAKAAGAVEADSDAMIVDIGADWMNVALVSEGDLIFARTMLGGSRRITQALAKRQGDGYAAAERYKIDRAELKAMSKEMEKSELAVNSALRESADSLAGLLTQALNLAKKEIQSPKYSPGKVLVTGGGALLKGLCEHLGKKMSKEVVPLDLAGLNVEGLDGESQELVKSGYFSTALGMAIGRASGDPLALHLVPLAVQQKRHFMESTVWALAAAPIFLLAFLLLWWQAGSQASAHQAAESQWAGVAKNLKDTEQKVDGQMAQLKAVTRLRDAYVGKDLWGRRFVKLLAMLHKDQAHFGEGKPFQVLEIRPREAPNTTSTLAETDRNLQFTVDILLQYDEGNAVFTPQSGPQQQMSELTKLIEQDSAYRTSLSSPEKQGTDATQRLFNWRLTVAMSPDPDAEIAALAAVAAAPAAGAPGTTTLPGGARGAAASGRP